VWNTRGFEILKRNHYEDALENEEALAYFDKALKLDPQSMRAWFGKSVVFVRMGRVTESIEICGRILALYPHDVTVLTFKGRALLLLRRFDEARAVLESALRIDAKNAEKLNLMVITLIRLRRYDDALDNAIYALTLFPKDPHFWHSQASLLCDDLHRYDEALSACDEAISRDVTLPNIWAIKGDALRALGQEPEAIANYSHVLSLPCSDFFGWTARGRALMGLRRYEEALAAYDLE
jgi:tetratricopeptide (TPR) repeat protein